MKKRILAMLLAVCLIVSLLPLAVLAEDTEEVSKPSIRMNFNIPGSTAYVTMNAGDAAMYWETIQYDTENTSLVHMKDLANATDESDWNVKLEYPLDGIPTLTLRNATIINAAAGALSLVGDGQYAGSAAYDGDVELVLEGVNTLTDTTYCSHSSINFNITGTATITGSGSLAIVKSMSSVLMGIIHSTGDLVFDNTTVTVNQPATSQVSTHGIVARGGDITINGGSLKIVGYVPNSSTYNNYRPLIYSLWATKDAEGNGGDLNITGGAKVEVYASAVNATMTSYYGTWTKTTTSTDEETGEEVTTTTTVKPQAAGTVRLEGDLNITDSDVLFATVGRSYLGALELYNSTLENSVIGTNLNVTFDGGYTLSMGGTTSYKGTYDVETGTFTPPTYSVTTYTNEHPDLSVATSNPVYFEIKHTCVAGEATYEATVPGAACATLQTKITSCSICGEEMSREAVDLEGEPSKIHTPGKKVELTDQRETASIGTTAAAAKTSGKYVFQRTCSVCGETWTEEETFGAAMLWYTASSQEATAQLTNFNSHYNTGNYGASYKPKHILNPGDDTLYFVTVKDNETFADNSYVQPLTDTEKITAGEWNLKLEYPLYGTPVLTLKGAEIVNCGGLWYGIAGYTTSAPLKIVVEEDSSITNPAISTTHGGLTLRTTGDVTITGPGKLSIYSLAGGSGSSGIIASMGNIILDDADIAITKGDLLYSNASNALMSHYGDITIDGGSFSAFCYCPQNVTSVDPETGETVTTAYKSYRGFKYGIVALKNADSTAGGNVTIKNGAKVNISATLSGNSSTSKGIYGAGTVTFSESDVLISHGGYAYGDALSYGEALVLDYADGFVAEGAHDSKFTYNAETGEVTYPTTTTSYTTIETITASALDDYYLKVTPNTDQASLADFVRPSVSLESSLTLQAYIDVNIADGDGYVQFARNGVVDDEVVYLKNVVSNTKYYRISFAGIAAKEMKDVITFTVYNKDGKQVSKTYSTSIYEFAMNKLNETDDAKYKTLLVSLLNYGTMSQVQFSHNTDDLANANLTAEDWENAASVGTYGTAGATATTDRYYRTTYALESTICMQMYIYNDDVGTDGGYAIVTIDGVDSEIKLERAAGNDTASMFKFDKLVPKYARSTITWKFYKTGEDSATAEPSLIVTDSLENFVGRSLAAAPQYEELMIYCDSVAAYLNG